MNLTIHDYMILALFPFAAAGMVTAGPPAIMHFALILGTAILSDFLINYFLHKEKTIPKSAIITGFIIALILSPSSQLWMQAFIPLLAIVSKHLIKWKTNLFNPAALALLAGGLLGAFPSWWAVSPVVWPLGLFISWKIRKLEISLSFLVAYFALFSIAGKIDPLMEIGSSAAIFLAFFMATEPKTTPSSKNGKIIFGILLAVISLIVAILLPSTDFLLASLLICNIGKNHMNNLKIG